MKRRHLVLVLSILSVVSFSCDKPKDNGTKPTGGEDTPAEATTYHVTFINYNDDILYEVDVKENEAAEYKGETPTRPEDDEFTYEFEKWDKDLSSIKEDLTTKATYKYIAKENRGPIHWF